MGEKGKGRGKNVTVDLYNLQILNKIAEGISSISPGSGAALATEGTLISLLNATIASDQDIEILLVRDKGNADKVVQQITDYQTGVPVISYKDANGVTYIPVGEMVYLDPSAVLNLILTEALDQGTSLDAIVASTAHLDVNLSTIATEATLALIQAKTDNLDAALTTLFGTKGQKVSSGSAPVVLSTEQEAVLASIKSSIDIMKASVDLRSKEATLLVTNMALDSITNILVELRAEDTVNLDAPLSTLATEATLNNVLTILNNILVYNQYLDTPLSSRASEATALLIKANTDKLDIALTSLFGTKGQKASSGSAPVVLSTEQQAILTGIQTAVENIDLDVDGVLATEATLQATNVLLAALDAVVDGIKTDTAKLDVALSTLGSEVTLAAIRALLITIDADTTNLDVLLSTRASEATADLIRAKTDLLAPAVRTHNSRIVSDAGTIATGSIRGSMVNVGSADGVWNGSTIPPGISIPWGETGFRDTYNAITYDATGTEFIIEYTT